MSINECLLDFKHAAVWCSACWEDERQKEHIDLQRQQVKTMEQLSKQLGYLMDSRGVTTPSRPPPPSPVEIPTYIDPKPQTGIDYKWTS